MVCVHFAVLTCVLDIHDVVIDIQQPLLKRLKCMPQLACRSFVSHKVLLKGSSKLLVRFGPSVPFFLRHLSVGFRQVNIADPQPLCERCPVIQHTFRDTFELD